MIEVIAEGYREAGVGHDQVSDVISKEMEVEQGERGGPRRQSVKLTMHPCTLLLHIVVGVGRNTRVWRVWQICFCIDRRDH